MSDVKTVPFIDDKNVISLDLHLEVVSSLSELVEIAQGELEAVKAERDELAYECNRLNWEVAEYRRPMDRPSSLL